jgi:hypothetical protein
MSVRRTLLLVIPLVLAVAFCLYLAHLIAKPSIRGGLYAWYRSMDITGGRYRFRKFVLGVRFAETVGDTAVTKLYREVVGEPPPPVWGPVYGYLWNPRHRIEWDGEYVHASGWADGMTADLTTEGRFTRAAQRAALVKFFGILQHDGAEPASDYADAVEVELPERHPGLPHDVKDLPDFRPEAGVYWPGDTEPK